MKKKKIWVIEDDAAILDVIKIILTAEGYEVSCFQNAEFMAQPVESFPNLILLDHHLQRLNGDAICQMLKQDVRTAEIPVLLLSSHNSIREIADQCGADGFIEKPFDLNAFLSVVNFHLFKFVST